MRVVCEQFGAKREWQVGPYTNLRGANFRGVDLSGADLTGADLTDAILNEANLSNSRLDSAVLCGAILFRAVLTGASAVGANFRGAVLRESELHGTDLSYTIIDPDECEKAYGDASTRLPPGRHILMGPPPDEEAMGDSERGGYRRLRRAMKRDAPGQPLVPEGTPGSSSLSPATLKDLKASLARVFYEALDACGGDFDRFSELPDYSRASWFWSTGGGYASPSSAAGLCEFLVQHLAVDFSEIHHDGSVSAVLRPERNTTDSLTRHVLMAEYDRDEYGDEDEDSDAEIDIAETDINVKSIEQCLDKLSYYFESGFEPMTITRFWLRPEKRRTLLLTMKNTSDISLKVEVAASRYGQTVADEIWSEYEVIGEDPRNIDVVESGWTFEVEFEVEESDGKLSDESAVDVVREFYNPVSVSSVGAITGYEQWDNDFVLAVVRSAGPEPQPEDGVRAEMDAITRLRVLLDDAISAYVFTRRYDEVVEESESEEADVDDDLDVDVDDDVDDDDDDDDDDDVDADASTDTVSSNLGDADDDEVTEAAKEAYYEYVGSLGASQDQVRRIWGAVDDYLHDFDEDAIATLSAARWGQLLDFAKRGIWFMRSRPQIVDALHIMTIEQLDSHTFRVRMKPQAESWFSLDHEWVPPSQWRKPENCLED